MNKYEFSLLWPQKNKGKFNTLPHRTIDDLNIDSIISYITGNRNRASTFKTFLTCLPQDIEIIRHRQASFEDIMENKSLRETLYELLPYLSSLLYFNGRIKKEESGVFETIFRINELNKLIICADSLYDMFKKLDKPVTSQGFLNLRKWVEGFRKREDYYNLKQVLPEVTASFRKIKSISLGINLNSSLLPSAITIEKINEFSFTGKNENLFNSLFRDDMHRGLTSLSNRGEAENAFDTISPQMRNISKLINKTIKPVANRIKEFRKTNSTAMINLKNELDFLLEASKVFIELKSRGIQVSKPLIYPSSEKVIKLRESRNLNLALSRDSEVVPSDVNLNHNDSFSLISGPNSGGKTVYLQSIGLNQILAQTGLFVLGSDCQISIVDNIYTHYQIEEAQEEDQGRFGVEIKRLKEILPKITSNSLLLFNETFSSTNISEAAYIAEDILRYICEVGSRGAYTTHMHTLIDRISKINSKISGKAKLFSMTSELNTDRVVTYKIVRGFGNGYKYAMELAERMDICFDKLMKNNIIKCGQKR